MWSTRIWVVFGVTTNSISPYPLVTRGIRMRGSTSRPPPRASRDYSRSEVRLVGDRDVVVEQMLVVLGTDVFGHLLLHASVPPLARPGLIERVRVVDREGHFEHLVAVGQSPALDDVQLFG